jgi:hypothetical protein
VLDRQRSRISSTCSSLRPWPIIRERINNLI